MRNFKTSTGTTIGLSHRIELIPEVADGAYFREACGTSRFTWNWALAEWNRQFDAGLRPNAYSLKKEFNAIKYREYPWLTDVHRDAHAEPKPYPDQFDLNLWIKHQTANIAMSSECIISYRYTPMKELKLISISEKSSNDVLPTVAAPGAT